MQAPSLPVRSLVLTVATFGWTCCAQADPTIVAESPDHPKTYVDGATRSHQDLRWDADKHLLVGDVTYSTADYADGTQATRQDDFALAFPTVHFDSASGNFTVAGVVVAMLRHGLFGTRVELAPNTTLSIHRHHGVIYGRLLSDRG